MVERLQKLMARAGFGSRRENEAIIAAKRVTVNGKVARLGDKADPNLDRIEVDGRILRFESPIYIMLYKPKGVLSSTEDELNMGRSTVRDLVAVEGHLYPVGRLDKESEGLMLLTNDGALTHRLTHPRFGHKKVYLVVLQGSIPESKLERWRAGVFLDNRRTMPVTISVINKQSDHTRLLITMREGRKRQIRRVAASLGHPVTKLVRQQLGSLSLGNLKPGQWRFLTPTEATELQRSTSRRKSRR